VRSRARRVTLPEKVAVVLPCHGDTLWPRGPSDLCGVPIVKPAGSGSTAAQTLRCEHMDLVIPLNATSHLSSAPSRSGTRGVCARRWPTLTWRAGTPRTELIGLNEAGWPPQGQHGPRLLALGQPRYVYESVTIRLARHVPMRHTNLPTSDT